MRISTAEHVLGNEVIAVNSTLLRPAPFADRLSVRVAPENRKKLEKILEISLPEQPSTSVSKGTRSALWLGPDEWLILDEKEGSLAPLANKPQKFACSLVDVSDRNTAIKVSGRHAVETLNCGNPSDLRNEAFPIGKCTRTILGKAEIILWRTSDNGYRVEVWRSFADYVWKYLADSAKAAR